MSKKGKKLSASASSVDARFAAKLMVLAGNLVGRDLSYGEFGAMHVGAAAMSVQTFVERLLSSDQFVFYDTCSTRGSQWRKYCASKNSSLTAFHAVAKRFRNIFDEIDKKIISDLSNLDGGEKSFEKVVLLQEKRAYFYQLGESFAAEYVAYVCLNINQKTSERLDRISDIHGIDFSYWFSNVFDDDFGYLLARLDFSTFYYLENFFRSLLSTLKSPEREQELHGGIKFLMRSTGNGSRLALLWEHTRRSGVFSPLPT